jgi:hypothetical protein
VLSIAIAASSMGCGDVQAGGTGEGHAHDAGDTFRPRPDANIPPTGGLALEPWLAAGYYDDWTCETGAHYSQISPHGRVRVCSNAILVDDPATGEHHVGAASVEELLDARDQVIGRAVALRGRPDPGAIGWYFYARLQPGAQASLGTAPDASGVVADGWGDALGNAQQVCAQCHASAPRDFVFTDPNEL